ncbi:hypothetical protein FZI85_29290 [Mycobacterium sp. CBMA293]|uniref:hypothetical protein n=1 Tax=unclassified Mycolicibacterium TaxID=2636767 RepID=UPI0012DE92FA|nr:MULTISPECIES: hypothetical protein [unclassified Mycolicibacterium]MUL49557.1 hypothetical protein [Mycolicibacterium sp. CBMA 360]MUL61653.1 hypothetical protein [Mycolicibacterium sp. CBMA 335]MUL74389.1 hypothetical protein [Mycolicibacterium sp. CBMA 311]MUL96666.1 hypothetical protein [Mycolicibacterium sp. CBMA 230]MUM15089.1 hypothetical protein [Mycolicibacterium sp. CBMA 293]
MTHQAKRRLAVVLVGLASVSGVFAPVAGARPTCQDSGTHTVCETNGSVSIKATPDPRSYDDSQSSRVGAQGRRGCYTEAYDRQYLCGQ